MKISIINFLEFEKWKNIYLNKIKYLYNNLIYKEWILK